MGATIWNHDARSGADNAGGRPAFQGGGWKGEQEKVFFDSVAATVETQRPHALAAEGCACTRTRTCTMHHAPCTRRHAHAHAHAHAYAHAHACMLKD